MANRRLVGLWRRERVGRVGRARARTIDDEVHFPCVEAGELDIEIDVGGQLHQDRTQGVAVERGLVGEFVVGQG